MKIPLVTVISEMQIGEFQDNVTVIQTDSVTEEPESNNLDSLVAQVDSISEEPVPSQLNYTDSATVNGPLNIQVDVHHENDSSSLTGQSGYVNATEAEISQSSQ